MRRELDIFGRILCPRYLVSRIFRFEKHCTVLSTRSTHILHTTRTSELLVATLDIPGDMVPVVVGSGLAETIVGLPGWCGSSAGACGYEARWGCCGFGWCSCGPGGALCTTIGTGGGPASTGVLPPPSLPALPLTTALPVSPPSPPRNDSCRYWRTWFFCFCTTW